MASRLLAELQWAHWRRPCCQLLSLWQTEVLPLGGLLRHMHIHMHTHMQLNTRGQPPERKNEANKDDKNRSSSRFHLRLSPKGTESHIKMPAWNCSIKKHVYSLILKTVLASKDSFPFRTTLSGVNFCLQFIPLLSEVRDMEMLIDRRPDTGMQSSSPPTRPHPFLWVMKLGLFTLYLCCWCVLHQVYAKFKTNVERGGTIWTYCLCNLRNKHKKSIEQIHP